MIIVGIDPGVTTGLAVWDDLERKLTHVESLKIHEAMQRVAELKPDAVIFEDARQRSWFGGRDAKQKKFGAGVREGAGSVKRDCAIWDDYLKSLDVRYIARGPGARSTKWKPEQFKTVTKWTGRTSEHARDAALLVYGLFGHQLDSMGKQSELRVTTLRKARATRRKRRKAAAEFSASLKGPADHASSPLEPLDEAA